VRIGLSVNGERYELEVGAARRLADVLRDDLGLVGTKIACGEGACGSCAVLLDGRAVNSCLLLAAAAEGHQIVTIEGLAADGLTPVMEAFVAADALQCGFCTAGQVIAATSLLAAVPSPDRDEIRHGMAGNLCRCGCYPKIEQALATLAAGG